MNAVIHHNKANVTTPSDREIRIERIFNAPRERVWKAMTDPALVAQWWGRGNQEQGVNQSYAALDVLLAN